LNPKFATVPAERSCELRFRGTSKTAVSERGHDMTMGKRLCMAIQERADRPPGNAAVQVCRCRARADGM